MLIQSSGEQGGNAMLFFAEDPLTPSDKLGSLPLWDWIIDASPGRAFLIMLVISPIMIKFVIRPFVEGRILRRRDEFMSFHFDMFLAFALGCGAVLVDNLDDRVYLRQSTWVDWLFLAGSVLIGVIHYAGEYKFYRWRQMLSLSKIYHELLFPLMGYALMTVCLYGLIFAPWSFELILMRLLMLVAIATWASAWPIFDERRRLVQNETGENLYDLAHVADSWPWQHGYAKFGDYLRLYLDDWRQVPSRYGRLWNRLVDL